MSIPNGGVVTLTPTAPHGGRSWAAALVVVSWPQDLRIRDRDVSLASVSRELAVSPRTLQRRLGEEGTSLREQTDAVRRRQATRLLAEGKSRLSVAMRLGYSDDRTLRRAMRRWESHRQPPDGTGPSDTAAPTPQTKQPGAFATHPDAFRPSPPP
jgi:AraC-like DNA-binding protein